MSIAETHIDKTLYYEPTFKTWTGPSNPDGNRGSPGL